MADLKNKTGKNAPGAGEKAKTANKQSEKEKNQLKGSKQDQGKGKGKDSRPNKANQAASASTSKVKPGDKGNHVVLKQSTKNTNKGKGKDKPNNKTNKGASTTGKDQTKAAGRRADHEGKTLDVLEGVQDGLNLVTNILTGGLFPGFI